MQRKRTVYESPPSSGRYSGDTERPPGIAGRFASGLDLAKRAVGQNPPPKRVESDDFKASSVQMEVFKECITHPATILPVAGSAAVFIFSAAALSLTFTPIGAGIAALLFFGGGTSFIWNYVINGDKRAQDRIRMLMDLRRQQFAADFDQAIQQCDEVGFSDGADRARQLQATYANLQAYFDSNPQPTLLQFRSQAEDTFKQGLATVTAALNVYKVLQTIDTTNLNRDLTRLRAQQGKDASKAASLKASIEDLEGRLERMTEKKGLLDELLAKVTQIESVLQTTHLDLVELGSADPTEFLTKGGGAMQRLSDSVEAARKVEARLRGATDPEDDAKERMYLAEVDAAKH